MNLSKNSRSFLDSRLTTGTERFWVNRRSAATCLHLNTNLNRRRLSNLASSSIPLSLRKGIFCNTLLEFSQSTPIKKAEDRNSSLLLFVILLCNTLRLSRRAIQGERRHFAAILDIAKLSFILAQIVSQSLVKTLGVLRGHDDS